MPRFVLLRQMCKSIQRDPIRTAINFVDRNNCQLKYQTWQGEINLYLNQTLMDVTKKP